MVLNIFKKIKDSMAKTRKELFDSLRKILPVGANITDDTIDEVEEVLYGADLGVHAVDKIVEELRENAGQINKNATDPFAVMKNTILNLICRFDGTPSISPTDGAPYVIFVIGVNGAGKTTTIGKLAMRFKAEGKTVLLAACDTFRAAAVEQLEIWAERSGSEFIKAHSGADAASVAFDAITRAKARSTDIVIVDTAGRLHTSSNLIAELKKIRRVLTKADENIPQETLLVLDSTTGQNALVQAESFHRELVVTGIALTKLYGTAKG